MLINEDRGQPVGTNSAKTTAVQQPQTPASTEKFDAEYIGRPAPERIELCGRCKTSRIFSIHLSHRCYRCSYTGPGIWYVRESVVNTDKKEVIPQMATKSTKRVSKKSSKTSKVIKVTKPGPIRKGR